MTARGCRCAVAGAGGRAGGADADSDPLSGQSEVEGPEGEEAKPEVGGIFNP